MKKNLVVFFMGIALLTVKPAYAIPNPVPSRNNDSLPELTQGPAGPTGPAGPIGATGATGATGPGGSTTIVTYQPLGDPGDGVFNDFALLVDYIASVVSEEVLGTRWTIQIDGSFVNGSAYIPGGTYALPYSVEFVGLANLTDPTLFTYPTLSGDAVFFNPPPLELYFTNIPFVEFNNLSNPPLPPVLSIDGVNIFLYLTGTTIIQTSISVINSGNAFVQLNGVSSLGSGIVPSISVDSTSLASITVFDAGAVNSGTLATASGGMINLHYASSAQIDPSFFTSPGINVIPLGSGPQSGTTTLVSGVSPAISAYLTSTSRITALYSNTVGSLGVLVAPLTDRTIGTPGSFILRSLNLNGTPETGDNSQVDWHIVDTGN